MKKLVSILLILVVAVCSVPIVSVSAYNFEYSYGAYNYILLDNGTAAITEYTSSSATSVSVPSSINGYVVTQIGAGKGYDMEYYRVFENCYNLNSVVIPYTVKTIAAEAFYECNNLSKVTIPYGVTEIGNKAFKGCFKLTSINLPGSLVSIGSAAFMYCNIKELSIPSSVTSIGHHAFGEWAIWDTVKTLTYNLQNKSYDRYVLGDEYLTYSFDSVLEYIGCYVIENLIITSDCQKVPDNLYNGRTDLKTVSIQNGVKSIGACAFMDCTNLTTVSLPNSINSIGLDAFTGCSKMKAKISCSSSVGNILSSAGIRYEIVHQYGNWITLVGPTCYNEGQKYRACNICGNLEYGTIAKVAHTLNKWEVENEPTYFKKGTKIRVCSVCGLAVENKAIPKLKLKTPTIKKIKGKKGNKKITFSKVKGASYYEVWTEYKHYGWTKYKTVKSTSCSLKDWKNYVKVRAVVKKGNKKVYSKFSKVKMY